MKNRNGLRYFLVGASAAFLVLPGCTQQSASGPSPYHVTSETVVPATPPMTVTPVVDPAPIAAPAVEVITPVPPAVASSAAPATTVPPLIISNAPAPVAVMPEKLRVSKALGDVIEMAQSGVDENVILTYVTNSSAAFLLGAEEIIYLKDLGVSSEVITSMMGRDQALKTVWGINEPEGLAGAPVEDQEVVAAAPTYVNPPQPASEQPAEVTDEYFDAALSPYGNWVTIDGYGRVWRPTIGVRSPGWRPYSDGGRWVYTDYGWYWMSDYSWGSVAFHYGRWFNDPRWGWCWWPNRVWGPSWVSWRYDNDYCGWAPLPPNSIYTPGVGFTYFGSSVGASFGFHLGVGSWLFVPWARFCDPHPYRYHLSSARSVAIFNQTTIVNNYGNGNNTTVINRGISVDRVRERSRAEVRTVSLRTEPAGRGGIRSDRFENGGRTLVAERPALSRTTGAASVGAGAPEASRLRSPRDVSEHGTDLRRAERSGVGANSAGGNSAARVPTERNLSIRGNESRTATQPSRTAPGVPSPATPVTRPTPIFDKPVTVERRTAPPRTVAPGSRSSQPTVIGGTPRSTGRDYSVWSTPGTRPQPNVNERSTTGNGNLGRTPTPSPNLNSPSQNRGTLNRQPRETLAERWQPRNDAARSRYEPSGGRPTYTAPRASESRSFAPRPASPPTTYTPPAPSRPTFNPAPAAPRVQPAPARPSGQPASPAGRPSGRSR